VLAFSSRVHEPDQAHTGQLACLKRGLDNRDQQGSADVETALFPYGLIVCCAVVVFEPFSTL
jgi:hypothetical protein